MQKVGDLRHILDYYKALGPFRIHLLDFGIEKSKLEEQLQSAMKRAESLANMLESDKRYSDALYLYQFLAEKGDGQSPYANMRYESLKKLVDIYEKMENFPAAEDVQERILLDERIRHNAPLFQQETRKLVNLYSLYH
jgi:hypothetical protein